MKLGNKNNSGFRYSGSLTGFTIAIFIVCLLNLLINVINGRFWLSDFKVYYMAAKTLVSGGQVYLQSFMEGSGFYKYSPFTLLVFLPYTLFDYTVASVIHFFILSFSFWYTFIVARGLLNYYYAEGSIKRESLLLSLAMVFILLHLVRELYLGNINIVLLMLLALALRNIISGKPLMGGFFYAMVLLAKPFFLILVIPLLLRKRWDLLKWTGIMVISGLLIPFIYPGPGQALDLYSGWFKIMLIHDRGFPGMNSLDYILQYYLFPALPAYAGHIIILLAGIAFSLLILMNIRLEKRFDENAGIPVKNFIFEWFLVIALIPNLVKTDSEHFLSTAPLLIFIIYYIASKRIYWPVPLMAVLFFFYGGNSYDLLGKELSQKFFSMGLLGISNVLIVILSILLFFGLRNRSWIIPGKEGTSS